MNLLTLNSLTVNLVTNYFNKLFSHQTTQHIHAYNKIYDTNATNFKSLTYSQLTTVNRLNINNSSNFCLYSFVSVTIFKFTITIYGY